MRYSGRNRAINHPGAPRLREDNISADQLNMLVIDKKRIKDIRERLSSVSWFIRCLNEYIARLGFRI
jgi:hypothetical protein